MRPEQQTAKFQPKASEKAGFLLTNYESIRQATTCTLANATGVRLEFIEAGSTGLVQGYKPPMILEPGQVASFLVSKATFKLKYNIQTFQGQAGWVRGEADTAVSLLPTTNFATIDAVVQVDQTTMYPTQFKFAVSRNGDAWQIRATQSIMGYSLTGKAAVLGSGDSIFLGMTGERGFAGGESWTIEVWVKLPSLPSQQAVFGGNVPGARKNLHCYFNRGKLHLDFFGGPAADDPTPIEVNVWTHFALQFEKAPPLTPDPADAYGDLRIFRNGVLVATNRSQPLIGNEELRLGRFVNDGRALSLLGSLAQVRLWNVAVPANEIKARLYTPGPAPSTLGLLQVLEFGKLPTTDERIQGITLEDFEVAPPAP